ncbi:hypothetical protein V8E51_016961 [Hyaloscypha variabilis]
MCYYRRRAYHREWLASGERHKKYSLFQYNWEGCGDFIPGTGSVDLPTKDGKLEGVQFSWRTTPTLEQEMLIATETHPKLPKTRSRLERSSNIEHFVAYSEQDTETPYIDNNQYHYIAGFINISLLRSCKKIRDEGAEILYGDNNFVFNVENRHEHETLKEEPARIPGIAQLGGNLQTSEQVEEAIEQIFDRKLRHPPFIWFDPLIHFLTMIGKRNAGLLKSIKLKGVFRPFFRDYLGFRELFPIYSLVLNQACANLRKIALELGSERSFAWSKIDHESGQTNEEFKNDAMKLLIQGLPNLTELVLGGYEIRTTNDGEPIWDIPYLEPSYDRWGPLQSWAKTVEARSEPSMLEQCQDHQADQDRDDTEEVSATSNDEEEAPLPGTILGYYIPRTRNRDRHFVSL